MGAYSRFVHPHKIALDVGVEAGHTGRSPMRRIRGIKAMVSSLAA